MSNQHVNSIIVGQGLAGTTLAWQLRLAGQRVMVLDRAEPVTASRIAAGLITPITGQRLVKSSRFDTLWSAATEFYRKIEAITQTSLFHVGPMVRLFVSADERQLFAGKHEKEGPDFSEQSRAVVNGDFFEAAHGGCELTPAGRLDVATYLETSRTHFQREDSFRKVDLNPNVDIQREGDCIHIAKHQLTADRVVFCQGYEAANNPWSASLDSDAAKGEILTLRIPDLTERRVVHRGIWLAAIRDDLFLAGATYDRERLDGVPTPKGRDELCERLRGLVKCPFEVVDHRAAVRPILQGKQPVFGWHHDQPAIGWFNGLGSKGSLQAPWFANQFAKSILQLESRATR